MQMVERPWGVAAYGAASVTVERSRLDLRSAWSHYGPDHKFLGYQCQAALALLSGNLDDVQPLLADLVAAGANEIEAVEFDVTAKPDLHAQARRQAVAAARNKAELYAEAAGVRLGAVIHIDDVDPEGGTIRAFRRHSAAAGETLPQDLSPGHVVITAAVILGFSIAHD